MIDPICDQCGGFMRLGKRENILVCTNCKAEVMIQDPLKFLYEMIKDTDYQVRFEMVKALGMQVTITKQHKGMTRYVSKIFEGPQIEQFIGSFLSLQLVEMKNDLAKALEGE